MKQSLRITKALQSQIYAHTGLHLDKQTQYFFGRIDGYFCQLHMAPHTQSLRIAAAIPEDDETEWSEVNTAFVALRAEEPLLTSCELIDCMICAELSCPAEETPSECARVLRKITAVCRSFALITCCVECGSAECANTAVGDLVQTLCTDCAAERAAKVRAAQHSRPRWRIVILSALVGTAAGLVLICLLSLIDSVLFFAAPAALLISFGIVRLFGQRIERRTVAVCTVCSIAVAVFSGFFCVSTTLADSFAALHETTYTDAAVQNGRIHLERIVAAQEMSDEELYAALSAYSAEEIEALRENLPAMEEEVRLELADADFVLSHTKPQECLLDLSAAMDWAVNPDEFHLELVVNILIGLVLIAAIAVPSSISRGKERFAVRTL